MSTTSPAREASVRDGAMTIGQLSPRTGVPVKALRRHEGMGLIYTLGRSSGGYRLFDESAIACVRSIRGLRSLGLTDAQIAELAAGHNAGQDIRTRLSELLQAVRARLDAHVAQLVSQRRRLDEFEARHAQARIEACPLRINTGPVLDSATGGRP